MTLATLLPLYCSDIDLEDYLSVIGVRLRTDDSQVGAPDATGIRRKLHARVMATETLNYYLYALYDPNNIATSNLANLWAIWFGAYWLCGTRGNPAPEQLIEDVGGAEDKLKDIYAKRHFLPGIPVRRTYAPVWDNVRVDPRFNFRCIRIEMSRSSTQPTNIPLSIDWDDRLMGSYEL